MGLLTLIDKFHAWTNSLIKDRFPLVSLYYDIKPRSWWYWRTQPIHKLYKSNIESTTHKKSALFFTVHKSASTFFNWYLKDLCAQTGHIYVDVNGYFGTQGDVGVEKQNEPAFKKRVFRKKKTPQKSNQTS